VAQISQCLSGSCGFCDLSHHTSLPAAAAAGDVVVAVVTAVVVVGSNTGPWCHLKQGNIKVTFRIIDLN